MPFRVWFVPSKSGDFRLTSNGDAASILTVEDPTADELRTLADFLTALRRTRQRSEAPSIDPFAGISKTGRSTVDIRLPLAEAGNLLVYCVRPTSWTAVRSVGGRVELLTEDAPKVTEAIIANPEAEAAVSFAPPGKGCPAPLETNYRASQVLRTFVTADQWETWVRDGRMRVTGNLSGDRYTVFHRDAAAKRGMGHSVVNSRGVEVCVWDDTVPAEEEALSIKLALEHNEGYILDRHGASIDRAVLTGG